MAGFLQVIRKALSAKIKPDSRGHRVRVIEARQRKPNGHRGRVRNGNYAR